VLALAALALAAPLGRAEAAAPVLERAEAALSPAHEPVGIAVSPTVALRDLALRLDDLAPPERRRARAILARPTDGTDPLGNNYSVPEQDPHCGEHICVHYVATTNDAPSLQDTGGAPGVPDYVEQVAATVELAYATETGPLRWPAPISDGSLGGPGGKTDVYLADVGEQGIFGYTAPDPEPAQRCSRRCHAYLVLDDDYSPAEFEYANPGIPLAVTSAHELNHVLQFSIDALQDGWLLESTAVWIEERVFPDADDWLNYIPAIAGTPGTPITDFEGAGGLRVYGAAVWNHWLTSGGGGYGPGLIVRTWLGSVETKPRDFAVAAYDRAIRRAGKRDFAREFVRFAAATAEWRAGAGAFPDHDEYADVRRKGSLRRGASKRFELDHTAYRLLTIRVGGGSVALRVRGERGVRAGIGLVARTGERSSGAVRRRTKMLDGRGHAALRLRRARRFERITAVVVNADGRTRGHGARDWRYRHDDARFVVRATG
jgi:hypothetical protein